MRKTTNNANKIAQNKIAQDNNKVAQYKSIDIKGNNKGNTQQSVQTTIIKNNTTQGTTQGATYNVANKLLFNQFALAMQEQLAKTIVLTSKQVDTIDTYKKQLKVFNEKYTTKQERDTHKSERPTLKGDILHLYNKTHNKIDIDIKAISKDIKKDIQSKLDYFSTTIASKQVDKNNYFKIKFDATICVALWDLLKPIFNITMQIDYNLLKGAIFSAYKVCMQKEKQQKQKATKKAK